MRVSVELIATSPSSGWIDATKSRVIRDLVLDAQAPEPAVRQVYLDLCSIAGINYICP